MSVVGAISYHWKIPFGLLETPESLRLPAGMWNCGQNLVGDGSGGTALVSLSLDRKYIYSLEGFGFSHSADPGITRLLWRPGQLTAETASLELTINFTPILAVSSYNVPAGVLSDVERFPISLANDKNQNNVPLVSLTFSTNNDGVTYPTNWWGYYWPLVARLQPGGPIRP